MTDSPNSFNAFGKAFSDCPIAGFILFCFLLLPGCRQTKSTALDKLATLGPSAWSLPVSGTNMFDSSTLYELIDGAADTYVDQGLQQGIMQQLGDGAHRYVEYYIMFFSDSSGSRHAFEELQKLVSGVRPINSNNFESAAADLGPATNFYAIKGRWLFEAHMTGFSHDEAVDAAINALQQLVHHTNLQ